MSTLKQEYNWYRNNQSKLAEQHEGKVLVIKNRGVIGVFDDKIKAIKKTALEHDLGTFLVQKCASDPESTTATFHSRVALNIR